MKELFLRSQEKLEQWSSLILRRRSFPYQQSQQTFECLPSRLGADDKKDKNLHLADGHLAGKCRGSRGCRTLWETLSAQQDPGMGVSGCLGDAREAPQKGGNQAHLAKTQEEGSRLRRNWKQGSFSCKSFSRAVRRSMWLEDEALEIAQGHLREAHTQRTQTSISRQYQTAAGPPTEEGHHPISLTHMKNRLEEAEQSWGRITH